MVFMKNNLYSTLAYFDIAGKRCFAALHAAICANYERQFGLIFPAPAAKMHRLPRCARRRSKPETAGQARRSYENAYDNAYDNA